jgi:hypothetical protein
VIYRLMLDIPTTPGSIFQRLQNHRTGGWAVYRNGKPVIECSTTQEADDEIADLEREVRLHTPKAAAMKFAHTDGRQAIDDLFGSE